LTTTPNTGIMHPALSQLAGWGSIMSTKNSLNPQLPHIVAQPVPGVEVIRAGDARDVCGEVKLGGSL